MKKTNNISLHFVKNLYKKLLPQTIRLSETISPTLSARIAYAYWRRTFRHPPSAKERPLVEQARVEQIGGQEHPIPLYYWGNGSYKVLLTGGWNGRPSQFHALIRALSNKDVQIVGLDPPGHGRAEGKSSSLLQIAAAIETVVKNIGPIDLFVGHSAGAMAGVIANAQGASFARMVLIAMPNSSRWLLDSYCQTLGLSPRTRDHMEILFERRHGENAFDRSSPILLSNAIRIPTLLIHDKQDKLVPLRHSTEMKNTNDYITLHETKGLGHFRIINAAVTVKEICEFASINSLEEADIENRRDFN